MVNHMLNVHILMVNVYGEYFNGMEMEMECDV